MQRSLATRSASEVTTATPVFSPASPRKETRESPEEKETTTEVCQAETKTRGLLRFEDENERIRICSRGGGLAFLEGQEHRGRGMASER